MPDQIALPELTHAQIVQFHRDGFMALEAMTTESDLDNVRELLDGLFDRFDELPKELAFDLGDKKLHKGPQVTPQINKASHFEPKLRETYTFKAATEIAKQLLGEDATYAFDHSIYKPPHNNRQTPWHQDVAYARQDPDPYRWNVAFWIPLQDATVESGCMQFVPNSHLGNLLPHHPVDHDPANHTLETGQVDTRYAVPCPIKRTGATLHMPKTLHYTGPNVTDQPRRAWIINFSSQLSINLPPTQDSSS